MTTKEINHVFVERVALVVGFRLNMEYSRFLHSNNGTYSNDVLGQCFTSDLVINGRRGNVG